MNFSDTPEQAEWRTKCAVVPPNTGIRATPCSPT